MGDIVGSAFSLSETLGVSRTVQQLLQRHRSRLSVTSTPSNVTLVTGVHQPRTDSECESESETESRLRCNQVQCTTGSRPDPIGSSNTYDGATFERDSNANVFPVDDANENEDAETEALAKLRCQSIRTEIIAEKFRRKNRCADYPGFAFGFSLFSSDTMMKFNIIKNELHNIMNNQLKRVSTLISLVHHSNEISFLIASLSLFSLSLSLSVKIIIYCHIR